MSVLRSRTRRKLHKRLAVIYGDCCYYCGRGFAGSGKRQRTLDHLFPRSRGGTNEISNLVLCCRGCNHVKGAMTWIEFVRTERYRQRRMLTEERPRRRVEVLTSLDGPVAA